MLEKLRFGFIHKKVGPALKHDAKGKLHGSKLEINE
jgi:hypothetical protein